MHPRQLYSPWLQQPALQQASAPSRKILRPQASSRASPRPVQFCTAFPTLPDRKARLWPEDLGTDPYRVLDDPATRDLCIVALSASAMPEDIALARRCGASDYWTKPLDADRFLADVRALLPVAVR